MTSRTSLWFPLALSIGAALFTLGLKSVAAWLTGSVGLLSDALESVVNLVAAATALFCLWYSSLPVDAEHTYGHEKIEFFSSGLEGMLIMVAAGSIAWYAVKRLLVLEPVESLGLGVMLALLASLVNLGVGWLLLRRGRAAGSILLEANGQHLMTDVYTSVGVVVGVFLVSLTGWTAVDPIVALAMAANIAWTGAGLIRRSFDGLMDHALPLAEQNAVRAAVAPFLREDIHYHALRTRLGGRTRFVEFHLLVPGAWSVQQAHDFLDQVEEAIAKALPGVEVSVHLEPIEHGPSWADSVLLRIEEAGRKS
ncbi:MAG: cation diffusion facilitator family transporter [Gemmataceae bacterium]|nr:cation diffusion facilitator family transporter [Gemmataceae bacterium]